MGLAPILVDRIYETVAEINRQGTTILLVEQNANYALEVSNRGYVLETGRVVARRRVGVAARRTPKSRRPTSAHDPSSRSSAPRRSSSCISWLASAIVARVPLATARATASVPASRAGCC